MVRDITPWNPEWQEGQLKRARPADGPGHFWAAILGENGEVIAAGPAGTPSYHWRGGRFVGSFSQVPLAIVNTGKVNAAWVIGVNPDTKMWYPLAPLALTVYGHEIRKGDNLLLKVEINMFEDA